jgi:hypothetical protein
MSADTKRKIMRNRRQKIITRLNRITGYRINYNRGIYSIWDGTNRWFPYYTTNGVLVAAEKIRNYNKNNLLNSGPSAQPAPEKNHDH